MFCLFIMVSVGQYVLFIYYGWCWTICFVYLLWLVLDNMFCLFIMVGVGQYVLFIFKIFLYWCSRDFVSYKV